MNNYWRPFLLNKKSLHFHIYHCCIPCIWYDSLLLFFKVIGFQELCYQQVIFETGFYLYRLELVVLFEQWFHEICWMLDAVLSECTFVIRVIIYILFIRRLLNGNWIWGVSKLMLSGWYNILWRLWEVAWYIFIVVVNELWPAMIDSNISTSVLDKDLLPIISEFLLDHVIIYCQDF